jgi:mannose-6-phosphate isomerase-like protein (cupin superfamily)
MNIDVLELFEVGLRFEADGAVVAGPRRMDGGPAVWQVASFRVACDDDVHGDYWEKHPPAEEAVCCLRGGLRVIVRAAAPDDADEIVTLSAGQATIVPRDRWHRLELVEPSDIMTSSSRTRTALAHRSELEG